MNVITFWFFCYESAKRTDMILAQEGEITDIVDK